jgi:hypothetical protein
MREYDTGATRDDNENKLNYEGFLSPAVLQRFAEYMHEKRVQPDGKMRSGDNWQKGIPRADYMDSMWRHFMDVWMMHRNVGDWEAGDLEESLCALMFNVMGYLFDELEDIK